MVFINKAPSRLLASLSCSTTSTMYLRVPFPLAKCFKETYKYMLLSYFPPPQPQPSSSNTRISAVSVKTQIFQIFPKHPARRPHLAPSSPHLCFAPLCVSAPIDQTTCGFTRQRIIAPNQRKWRPYESFVAR